MDHPDGVIGPHVIPAVLTKLTDACVQIAVAHVTVREHDATWWTVPLQQFDQCLLVLIHDGVDDRKLGASAPHAKYPSYSHVNSQAAEVRRIDLALIYLDDARQLQVWPDFLGHVVRQGPSEKVTDSAQVLI